MIIAVDFDGTLTTGKFPEIGGARPYAVEMMRRLKADGHYLILWTCRRGERLEEAINWLLAHGIPFDRVNAHQPESLARYGNDPRKVYAHCYIDDKQVGGLPPWPAIYDYIAGEERRWLESAGKEAGDAV